MQQLFNELMNLSLNADTPFYHADQEGELDERYRIFGYHFTDSDSWLLPSALESRGIMFEIDKDDDPVRLAARPMPKFFNYSAKSKQGEATSFTNYGDPIRAMNKADGSLISTYSDFDGDIRCKSKMSINSRYAHLAQDILYNDPVLLDFVVNADRCGYTVNMEVVSPDPKFRIVLHYPEEKLIVLNARHRTLGTYMAMSEIPSQYFTGFVELDVLDRLSTDINVEGYVVQDDSGNWWKEKCDWYLERHRAKDFVNQPLAFIKLVLAEEADDIYTLLADQPEVLQEMQELQRNATSIANTIINTVTAYYNDNKDLIQKDYAIKAKAELEWLEFALAMQFYSKGEPDWNQWFTKKIKKIDWGIE